MAASTASGMTVGPGMERNSRPAETGMGNLWGGNRGLTSMFRAAVRSINLNEGSIRRKARFAPAYPFRRVKAITAKYPLVLAMDLRGSPILRRHDGDQGHCRSVRRVRRDGRPADGRHVAIPALSQI